MDLMTGVNSHTVSSDIYSFNSLLMSSSAAKKTSSTFCPPHPDVAGSKHPQPKRKMSPPLAMAARLFAESKLRSGSDPALVATSRMTSTTSLGTAKATYNNIGNNNQQQQQQQQQEKENKRSFWERSLSKKGKSSVTAVANAADVKSLENSPKVGNKRD